MLESVKALLGLTDDSRDSLLNSLIKLVSARLCTFLGVKEVPDELSYIVTELTVRRFNRIGSEGFKQHTLEGEAIQFESDDFSDFAADINAWKEKQEGQQPYTVRFL